MIPDATTMIFGSEPRAPRRRVSLGNERMCENRYHGLRSLEMKLSRMSHNRSPTKKLNLQGKRAKCARAYLP